MFFWCDFPLLIWHFNFQDKLKVFLRAFCDHVEIIPKLQNRQWNSFPTALAQLSLMEKPISDRPKLGYEACSYSRMSVEARGPAPVHTMGHSACLQLCPDFHVPIHQCVKLIPSLTQRSPANPHWNRPDRASGGWAAWKVFGRPARAPS